MHYIAMGNISKPGAIVFLDNTSQPDNTKVMYRYNKYGRIETCVEGETLPNLPELISKFKEFVDIHILKLETKYENYIGSEDIEVQKIGLELLLKEKYNITVDVYC